MICIPVTRPAKVCLRSLLSRHSVILLAGGLIAHAYTYVFRLT
jgi:hypothetical protein